MICRDFLEMSPITMSTYREKSRPNLSKGADRVNNWAGQAACNQVEQVSGVSSNTFAIDFPGSFCLSFHLLLIFGSFSQDTQLYMFQLSFDTLTILFIYHCFPVFFLTSSVELSLTHSIEMQNQRHPFSSRPV